MKFSVLVPIDKVEPAGEFQSPSAARDLVVAMEKAGVTACHLTEHPAPLADWLHNDPAGHDALDPFTGLAFLAGMTEKIMLLTNVVVLPYRNPFLTAKAAASLQVLSGGRLILGVGAGYQRGEFDALGVPMNKRGKLMDEALETIRLAWGGGAVVRKGMGFHAIGNEPRPIPSPAPPIWIGGGSDKAVERAAWYGDGWVPFFSVPTKDANVTASSVTSLEEMVSKMTRLQEWRDELGRTGGFDLCCSAPYQPKSLTRCEAQRYGESVEQMESLGFNWIRAWLPAPSRKGFLESVAWYSEEVMANFPDKA